MPGNRGLVRLLGAVIFILIVIAIVMPVRDMLIHWSPPGVVPIPGAPGVEITLKEHPRLISTSDAVDALAEASGSAEHSLILSKAGKFYQGYLDNPLQGDTIYPGYFALAYRISGDETYLNAARDMVLNVCKFPKWNRKPESSNFYKIELAYAVGIAYDLLYDEFTPSERRKIEEDLSEVLDGLLWHIQGNPSEPFWYDAPHSNYYVAQHSAAGLLAICLGDKYPDWERALNFAYDGLQPSIELLKKDGGWIEGLTYQDFCWGQHGLLFLNALRVNNGPNRFEEEWFKTSVLFAVHGILPGGRSQINFGDNTEDPTASWGYILRAKPFFGNEYGSWLDYYITLENETLEHPGSYDAVLINAVLEHDPSLPIGTFEEPSPCQYFPGIEWVMMRENWTDPDSFFFATKAGYGGWDHNHVDQGTFILAYGGEIFITDPGKGVFSARTEQDVNMIFGGPYGHSVFIPGTGVEPLGWDEFTMYNENASYRQADAVIENWIDTEEKTSFTMDLGGAYPSEGLTEWSRTIEWRKPNESHNGIVLITDTTDVPGIIRFVTEYPFDEDTFSIEGRYGNLTIAAKPGEGLEIPSFVDSSALFGLYNVITLSKTEDEGLQSVSIALVPMEKPD